MVWIDLVGILLLTLRMAGPRLTMLSLLSPGNESTFQLENAKDEECLLATEGGAGRISSILGD